MKHKALSMVAALQLAMFGSLAHADVVFQLSDPDICSNVVGTWVGDGNITALKGTLNCTYHGSANVTKTATGFDMAVTLKKASGSFSCPAAESLTLPGSCNNGVLLVNTSQANLQGTVDNTYWVDMKGTVKFKAPIMGIVTATVTDMKLHKM